MTDVCHSGGSKGADTIFGECAREVGHSVWHYSFLNHHCAAGEQGRVVCCDVELMKAHNPLLAANKILDRKYPTRSEYVNNLLRRNYYQICVSSSIYAVCLIDKNGIPVGGTAWAIAMGIQRGITNINVFDPEKGAWYKFISLQGAFKKEDWKVCWYHSFEMPPIPSGHYAGIGMSELPDSGAAEIQKLYGV
jgi:hypothetical protein